MVMCLPLRHLVIIVNYQDSYIYCVSLTPLTPFFSMSSINRERYSGDFSFRFTKNSKSWNKSSNVSHVYHTQTCILGNLWAHKCVSMRIIYVHVASSLSKWTHTRQNVPHIIVHSTSTYWCYCMFEEWIIVEGTLQEHVILVSEIQ